MPTVGYFCLNSYIDEIGRQIFSYYIGGVFLQTFQPISTAWLGAFLSLHILWILLLESVVQVVRAGSDIKIMFLTFSWHPIACCM